LRFIQTNCSRKCWRLPRTRSNLSSCSSGSPRTLVSKTKALADAVEKQQWDPSVQGLAALPQVVKLLAGDIGWTADLGNASLAQQSDVMDAVQRMRKKAQDKGTPSMIALLVFFIAATDHSYQGANFLEAVAHRIALHDLLERL
jgi:hypothetical protein